MNPTAHPNTEAEEMPLRLSTDRKKKVAELLEKKKENAEKLAGNNFYA